MKTITIQANGQLGFLGKAQAETELLLEINGRDTIGGDLVAGIANVNVAPVARAQTGVLGTTRLATPKGQVAVHELAAGDLVVDAAGNPVAIKHILKTAATKTAICIRAPYFGLDQDLIVGADHRIAVTSDAAEYLFGEETVLVPTWALKDGRRAQHWEMPPNTHMYQIQLETVAALKVGNCAVESMPKSGKSIGKVLSHEEARCFAGEHKSGYQN